MRPERIAGSAPDLRMIGQSEIIVGAEIDDFPAVPEPDVGILRAADDPLPLEQARLPYFLKGFAQLVLQFTRVHAGKLNQPAPADNLKRSSLANAGNMSTMTGCVP